MLASFECESPITLIEKENQRSLQYDFLKENKTKQKNVSLINFNLENSEINHR